LRHINKLRSFLLSFYAPFYIFNWWGLW